MDGTEILYVIFEEFSESEVEPIAQLFENSHDCKKTYTEDKDTTASGRRQSPLSQPQSPAPFYGGCHAKVFFHIISFYGTCTAANTQHTHRL